LELLAIGANVSLIVDWSGREIQNWLASHKNALQFGVLKGLCHTFSVSFPDKNSFDIFLFLIVYKCILCKSKGTENDFSTELTSPKMAKSS